MAVRGARWQDGLVDAGKRTPIRPGDRSDPDVAVAGEALGDSIRRMRVEVEHGDATSESLAPQNGDGHGDVVDGAEPARARFARVMESPERFSSRVATRRGL